MTGGADVATSRWTLKCKHPDYLYVSSDFSELALGAGSTPPGKSNNSAWLGGFSGRPELLDDIMPTIDAIWSVRAPAGSYRPL